MNAKQRRTARRALKRQGFRLCAIMGCRILALQGGLCCWRHADASPMTNWRHPADVRLGRLWPRGLPKIVTSGWAFLSHDNHMGGV